MKQVMKKMLCILLASCVMLGMTAQNGFTAYAESTNSEDVVSESIGGGTAADEAGSHETAGGETAGDEAAGYESAGSEASLTEAVPDETTSSEASLTEAASDETTGSGASLTVAASDETAGSETSLMEVASDETAGSETSLTEATSDVTAGSETSLTEAASDVTAGSETSLTEAAEDETAEDETGLETEEQTETEEERPAFSESMIISGVKITVTAPEGVFPGNARLFVESVPVQAQQMVDEAIEGERGSDVHVAVSYTFDIKVLDPDGNELQPANAQSVTVAFSLAEAADANLDAQVYHVSDNGEAATLDTSTSGRTVEAVSDGFSYYTVEFTYATLTYVLPGSGEVRLSEILEEVGLAGQADAARSSNEELFSVSNASGEWMLYSLRSFTTEETLTVTIQGIDYEITVSDPVYYDIWVGSTQVTSSNMKDIFKDGGSAQYIPELYTLVLTNPPVSGLRDEAQIYAIGSDDLIITGYASLMSSSAQYGIKKEGTGDLIIGAGTISAKGTRAGIYAIGDIGIDAGIVNAEGGDNGISSQGNIYCDLGVITAYGKKNGIYANESVSVSEGAIITTGGEYGLSAKGKITVKKGSLTAKGEAYHGIYTKSDVSSNKEAEISAEGKQKGILAEGNIWISGKADAAGGEDGFYAEKSFRHDGTNLTAEGNTGYGIYAAGDLYLSDGSVNAEGHKAGIYSDGSEIRISGGNVTAKSTTYGIFSNADEVNIGNSIESVTADGGSAAVRGKLVYLWDKVVVKDPDPFMIAKDTKGYETIAADGASTAASHVEIISTLGYTVTFDANGHGTAPEAQFLKPGKKATQPEDPQEEGYLFKGWYTDPNCKTAYNFSSPVEEDITLYAKWEKDSSIPVHTISIYNVAYPLVGEHPNTKGAKVTEDGVDMRGIGGWYWYDYGASEWIHVKDTDTFEPSKTYYPFIYVNAEDGYRIASDARGTVNGGKAEILIHPGDPIVRVRAPFVAASPCDSLFVVTAGSLNVRSDAGFGGDRIGGLKFGEVIQAKGQRDDWILIDYEGTPGWVNRNYLALTYSRETAIMPITYKVTGAGAVNVRSDISTSSTRIGGLTYGKEVLVTGIRTDADGEKWLVMDYDGDDGRQLGYVVARYTHTDSSVEFTYEETEPEENENVQTAEEDEEAETVHVEGTNPKVTMGGVTIWAARSAIAHDGNASLNEENYETPGDGTAYALIYPDDAKNYSSLSKANISLPSDWDVTLMDMTLQADGGILLRFGPVDPVTVSFETDNGSTVKSQVITSGTTAAEPEAPEKEGHTFAGWYADPECTAPFDFDTVIRGDTTVYAKWTEKTPDEPSVTFYTITYDLNGGILDGRTGIVTVSVEEGKTITLPEPALSGYTFDYWEGSRHEAGESYKVTGDHTFTAQWKKNSGSEDPDGNDGTGTQNGTDGTDIQNGSDGTGTQNGTDGTDIQNGSDGTDTPDKKGNTNAPDKKDDTGKSGKKGDTGSSDKEGPSATATGARQAAPATGDDTPVALYGMLLTVSCLVLAMTVFMKKRRKA